MGAKIELETNYLPEENLTSISAEDEVKRVEYEWGDAFERRDMATLDRLMADEYILMGTPVLKNRFTAKRHRMHKRNCFQFCAF